MDGYQFDRVAKRLARCGLSRRAALHAGFLGIAATALTRLEVAAQGNGTPAADGTPVIVNPDEIEIGGMWFCNQTFALCTTAPCEPSESDPTIANCHCIVEDSYSIGSKSCTDRAQSGANLVSNFSTVNVNSEFSIMTCPEDAPWANCLDVPCEIDSFNPAVATCQCVMVETGPSLTFGGGCDTSTCTTTVWSAAPTGFLGLEQFEEGMALVNETVTLPVTCPAGTPVASPTS